MKCPPRWTLVNSHIHHQLAVLFREGLATLGGDAWPDKVGHRECFLWVMFSLAPFSFSSSWFPSHHEVNSSWHTLQLPRGSASKQAQNQWDQVTTERNLQINEPKWAFLQCIINLKCFVPAMRKVDTSSNLGNTQPQASSYLKIVYRIQRTLQHQTPQICIVKSRWRDDHSQRTGWWRVEWDFHTSLKIDGHTMVVKADSRAGHGKHFQSQGRGTSRCE